MADWYRFNLTEKLYRDPRAGRIVDPKGRRNRPGVDPFEGGGHEGYPDDLPKGAVRSWQQRDTNLLILVDGAIPQKGQLVSKATALESLKRDIGLPADTTLGADGKPVIESMGVG